MGYNYCNYVRPGLPIVPETPVSPTQTMGYNYCNYVRPVLPIVPETPVSPYFQCCALNHLNSVSYGIIWYVIHFWNNNNINIYILYHVHCVG